jgi:hypothetical protein
MYHVFALLKQARAQTRARPAAVSREPDGEPDRIIATGGLGRAGGRGPVQEPPLPPRLLILAAVELLLPASGLLLGLQLWDGSLWWLWAGAGTLLSVLLGYTFRSHIQLYPLDSSQ